MLAIPSTFWESRKTLARIVENDLPIMVPAIILLYFLLAFNSAGTVTADEPIENGTYHIAYHGHEFDIPYRIAKGTLENIEVDIASEKVVILLSGTSSSDGFIEITIPRNLYWSDLLNEYNYAILVDGKEPSEGSQPVYLENTPCYRTVSIKFPLGSEKIEVMRPPSQPTLRHIGADGFIATDKACYRQGERVIVFGFASFPIDLRVQSEVLGEEYPPDINFTQYQNGSFTSTFVIDGSGAYSGIYGATASYKKDVNATFAGDVSDARFLLVESNYDGLTVGETSLVDDKSQKVTVAKETDYYTIAAEFNIDSNEPKTFQYVVMITDADDVAQRIFVGSFTAVPKQKTEAGKGYYLWVPEATGKYNLRAFALSSVYLPLQVITPAQSIRVEVKEKIIQLGEGERDRNLVVRDIDLWGRTAGVSYTICSNTGAEEERTIRVGESVLIAEYARAYLEGFENGKAIFRFEATGGGCPGVY
ncbi:MAG: hypothetical protein ACREBU_04540 [Nitrososphaera sp.]